jgi:hypothetical protein
MTHINLFIKKVLVAEKLPDTSRMMMSIMMPLTGTHADRNHLKNNK